MTRTRKGAPASAPALLKENPVSKPVPMKNAPAKPSGGRGAPPPAKKAAPAKSGGKKC